MKVVTKGHLYELAHFENPDNIEAIQFIEKYASPSAENNLVTVHDGTTNEEVLAMLIDRMNYLQGMFPCRENAIVITKLEECLMWLNKRTADRKARNVEGTNQK